VRPAKSLALSLGIHITIIALSVGAFSVVRTTLPIPPEKITLKVLLHSPEPAVSVPEMQPPEPTPKTAEPVPPPKPEKPHITTPPKPRVLAESQPTVPTSVPAISTPVVAPKTPEAPPAAVPKAPPPPKAQENYEEENLGRIRAILAERLKYPKNALRLKQQGEVSVTFTLGANRDVSQITITQSSGFELLDDAARNLIENSVSEFPKPSKSVRITVPIAYKLR